MTMPLRGLPAPPRKPRPSTLVHVSTLTAGDTIAVRGRTVAYTVWTVATDPDGPGVRVGYVVDVHTMRSTAGEATGLVHLTVQVNGWGEVKVTARWSDRVALRADRTGQ